MKRPTFTRLAEQDLDDILNYIALDNPKAAVKFVLTIKKKCEFLALFPEIGMLKLDLGAGIRSFPVRNYLIIYRASDEGIEVARILSGFRSLPQFFRH